MSISAALREKMGHFPCGGSRTSHRAHWRRYTFHTHHNSIAMQILQRPDKITIIYAWDHEVRHVRMDRLHPAQVTPSWYGDSVGHYEGDTLVIDTVAIKTDRPVAMLDLYGTPYTKALHVVERYRLLDYDATKDAVERVAGKNFRLPPSAIEVDVDPNYKGKGLQLQ